MRVMKVVVIGGGWSGCAAALAARNQGAEVVLIERTDMLLGTGLVGGIMRNNGRHTAAEEMIAMGGGDLFELADRNTLHRRSNSRAIGTPTSTAWRAWSPWCAASCSPRGVDPLPGPHHGCRDGRRPHPGGPGPKQGEEPLRYEGDVFIDATGTAGGPANCNKYGNGCAMCVLRCHSFGGRVSVTAKAGVKEMIGRKGDQVGAMSGSCKLLKESLDPQIVADLDQNGVAVVPLPPSKVLKGKLALKCCQQYAIPEFEENIILLDTGHAKLMTPFFPLDLLRSIPGFENARYEDPYAGGLGNSIRYVGMAPRDDALKVEGVDNLFCAGEKAGLLVGHTEAICTGTAGGLQRRASPSAGKSRWCCRIRSPSGTPSASSAARCSEEGILSLKYTFSGSVYFDRMQARSLYTTDAQVIRERVAAAGLENVFAAVLKQNADPLRSGVNAESACRARRDAPIRSAESAPPGCHAPSAAPWGRGSSSIWSQWERQWGRSAVPAGHEMPSPAVFERRRLQPALAGAVGTAALKPAARRRLQRVRRLAASG
ncbi:MAG: FAD-dependent oxidoreductase [Desulfobacterales bacterium]|nr:FAD-dependent oxidoreductase [Desulfobacterales bacterium]